MNLSNKRCGECGAKSYEKKAIQGKWNKPWKDFPSIFLTRDLELWVCKSCKSYAITPEDSSRIDKAIEESIQSQTAQFLEIIHSKSGQKYESIAHRLGYSSAYISSLKNKNKTPAFKLWNQLKSIAIAPESEMEKLDPDYDIIKNNLLLRA
mgnify:CR=1 FL=1